jgi:hypothetical protein
MFAKPKNRCLMRFSLTLVTFLIAINLNGQTKSYQFDLAIKDVNVIPCQENIILKNKTVLIKGDRIVEISDSKKVSAKAIINSKGKYLIPGLADMHVHFPEKDLPKFFDLNRSAGVLYLRSMRGDVGTVKHTKLRDSLTKNDPLHFI